MTVALALAATLALVAWPGHPGQPRAATSACKRANRTVIVDLDNRRHARILRHAWTAIGAGHPEQLHIARRLADRHRDQALRGAPSRPGFDADEYPPAVAREGGRGASVQLIRARENRSAGSVMGHQLRPYCDGTTFRFERRPR